MKPLLLALVALLSSCTPTEPGPVQEYQTAYHSATIQGPCPRAIVRRGPEAGCHRVHGPAYQWRL